MTDNLDTGLSTAAVTAGASVKAPPRPEMPSVLVFHDVGSLLDSFRVPDPDHPGPTLPSQPGQRAVPTTAPPGGGGRNGGSAPPHNGRDNGGRFDLHGGGTAVAGTVTPVPAYPTPRQATTPSPQPVDPEPRPEAVPVDPEPRPEAVPVGTVTDEDRGRYGVLLDRAAERGLLDPAEYEVRLRQLAEATTTEQMVAIVAELPAFTAPDTAAPRQSRSAIQSASRTAAGEGQRRRVIMWVLMGVLVALALASLVILALSVGRLSRSRSSMPPPPAATRPVSALRL